MNNPRRTDSIKVSSDEESDANDPIAGATHVRRPKIVNIDRYNLIEADKAFTRDNLLKLAMM